MLYTLRDYGIEKILAEILISIIKTAPVNDVTQTGIWMRSDFIAM